MPAQPVKRFDVVALGEAMVEFNQTRAQEPHYLQGFGGDTSNAAIAAAVRTAPDAPAPLFAAAQTELSRGALLLGAVSQELIPEAQEAHPVVKGEPKAYVAHLSPGIRAREKCD